MQGIEGAQPLVGFDFIGRYNNYILARITASKR